MAIDTTNSTDQARDQASHQTDAAVLSAATWQNMNVPGKDRISPTGRPASENTVSFLDCDAASLYAANDFHTFKPAKHISDKKGVTTDADGNKRTELGTGHYTVESKDGSTGYDHRDGKQGSFTETHWGKTADENYLHTVNSDKSETKEFVNGDRETKVPTGDLERINHDGTSYKTIMGADGKPTSETHKGPAPENNYELTRQPDNSLQGTDRAGNTHTKWADQKEQVDYTDGRGYTREKNGSDVNEHHWGPRPEDNFDLTKSADGKIEIREKPGDKPHEELDGDFVKSQRDALKEKAEAKIHDPQQLAKFHADMARLEDRSKEIEENYKKQGLSEKEAHEKRQQEVGKTYQQIGRILDAPDNPNVPIDQRHRIEIAEQVMSQAATPTSIGQLPHPTCNVTVAETRAYTRTPSEASRLVADMTTTGSYTTKSGTTVQLDQESLKPHDTACTNPPVDGGRSYASQLFQVTAVNVGYREKGSTLHYEQHDADPNNPNDHGDRNMDYAKTPPKEEGPDWYDKLRGRTDPKLFRHPHLTDADVQNVGNAINGEKEKWLVRHKDSEAARDSVPEVTSEQQLNEQIKAAKEQGKLPIAVRVHTGNEPFVSDIGNPSGNPGDWHVVTVTDYQEGPPARVALDNQWDSKVDHPNGTSEISVHDLYHSMRNPNNSEQIKELEHDVAYNKENGKRDYAKEVDLLRLKRQAGKGSEQNEQELASLIKDSAKELGHGMHSNDMTEVAKARHTWFEIQQEVNALPADKRVKMIGVELENGFMGGVPEFADHKLTETMASITKEKQAAEKDGKFDAQKKKTFERASEEFERVLGTLPAERQEKIRQELAAQTAPVTAG